jgi:hypothetical protein
MDDATNTRNEASMKDSNGNELTSFNLADFDIECLDAALVAYRNSLRERMDKLPGNSMDLYYQLKDQIALSNQLTGILIDADWQLNHDARGRA